MTKDSSVRSGGVELLRELIAKRQREEHDEYKARYAEGRPWKARRYASEVLRKLLVDHSTEIERAAIIEQPSLDDLRTMLLDQASKYSTKRRGHLGLSGWAREHRVLKSRVSEFLNGTRPPTDDLLAALGFERRIVPLALHKGNTNVQG